MAYIGKQPTVGNFVKLDAITTSATTTFNLTNGGVAYSPQSPNHCIVSLNGVIQSPTSAYTISGSTIVFSDALTSSDTIDFILVLGDVLNIGTPSDNTVSLAKLTATGTKDATTFLRGDNTFAVPAGKVLQVVQGTSSTSTSNNTTTYADSSLSSSITPASTSNKVLVLITQKFFIATGTSDRGSIKIKLLRGSTNIWEDTSFYFQTTGISGEIDRFVAMTYLDSPSTTSSTTYKTQFAIDSTATNKISYAQYGSMPSYLTLIEIAG